MGALITVVQTMPVSCSKSLIRIKIVEPCEPRAVNLISQSRELGAWVIDLGVSGSSEDQGKQRASVLLFHQVVFGSES